MVLLGCLDPIRSVVIAYEGPLRLPIRCGTEASVATPPHAGLGFLDHFAPDCAKRAEHRSAVYAKMRGSSARYAFTDQCREVRLSSEEHPETSLIYVSAAALTYIRRVTALLRRGYPSD